MTTSVKRLAAAVAATLCSGAALAYGPTITPDFTFHVAGGSAQGAAFLAFAQSLLKADGNLDVYTDDTSASCGQGANYRAVFGTWNGPTNGTLVNGTSKVYIDYANNGGTFKNGIDGLARAHAVDYGNLRSTATNTNCATAGGGTPAPFTAKATYHITALTTANFVPDVGLSDEEMGLFVGVNLPASGPNAPLTAADFTNTKQTGLYENVFGVAINNTLSASMTAAWTNNNISTAQMAAILAGLYTDWSQLCQAPSTGGAETCLPAGPITFISRAAGSGSKAAFNQYFLNNPGSAYFIPGTKGGTGTAVPPVLDNGAAGGDCTNFDKTKYNVCEQSSNGNVKKALDKADTTNGTFTPARAIGILGLEFQPVSGTDTYTFANLDGVDIQGVTAKTCGNATANAFEPARVVEGDHRLFFTNSLNVRVKNVAGAHFLGDGSVNATFMSAFSTAAASPTLQVSVPGVLLDPNVVGGPGGFPYDACITKGTHFGDSTQPLQLQF
jgi:hypothetical protein